jgi:CheY-like chemotaxis protein
MPWDHINQLKERIARFDEAIASFERTREEIIARRRSAADHIMLELDERLAVTSRTVEALQRSRELTVEDLKRQEVQGDRQSMPRCVVVDDNSDGRLFLSKTLLESFPRAEIVECEHSDAVLHELQCGKTAVFLLHRATDADGLPLVEMLRAASPTIPIIYLSGIDRTDAALEAGATTFLQYDQYRLIGQIVRDILRPPLRPPMLERQS